MGHLWKIALRAANTDVSLAAIQYINSYYMGQQLKLEKEFVAHCMNHLKQAAEDLDKYEYISHFSIFFICYFINNSVNSL